MMKKSIAGAALAGILASLLFSAEARAQQSCTPSASVAQKDGDTRTGAIFELRRQLLNPWFMPIAFHSIDSIFDTRAVPRGEQSTPLPRADRPLDFSYQYDGKTIPLQAASPGTTT
mgnify:CR=1 FL=1